MENVRDLQESVMVKMVTMGNLQAKFITFNMGGCQNDRGIYGVR